jgi:plasmid maintenance system antidote protein VapI
MRSHILWEKKTRQNTFSEIFVLHPMSIRFGAFFGQSDDFWHGIQVECDFRAIRKQTRQLIRNIRPAEALLA